jgi:hypothetical protein
MVHSEVTIRLGSDCATMLQGHSASHHDPQFFLDSTDRLIFGKGFLGVVKLLVGLDALQWILMQKATAAFLGTSCATCKLKINV